MPSSSVKRCESAFTGNLFIMVKALVELGILLDQLITQDSCTSECIYIYIYDNTRQNVILVSVLVSLFHGILTQNILKLISTLL